MRACICIETDFSSAFMVDAADAAPAADAAAVAADAAVAASSGVVALAALSAAAVAAVAIRVAISFREGAAGVGAGAVVVTGVEYAMFHTSRTATTINRRPKMCSVFHKAQRVIPAQISENISCRLPFSLHCTVAKPAQSRKKMALGASYTSHTARKVTSSIRSSAPNLIYFGVVSRTLNIIRSSFHFF
jgi:hypothetical protein